VHSATANEPDAKPAGAAIDDLRNKPTITPEVAATFLGCSLDLIYKGLRDKEIPGFKVGRRWFVVTAKLLAMVQTDGLPSRGDGHSS
jgi:excisionase family DNA binding protein